MANSGYLRKSMSSYFDFYIYWEIQSQSIANNTSTVYLSWGTQKKKANTQTYNLNSSLTAKYGSTTFKSGATVSFDMRSSSVGDYKSLANTTITVNHNSDGTLNLYLYGYLNVGSLSLANSAEISGYATLPTIPRASGITATDGYVGGSCNITIDKKNPDFTTTVSYKIAGQSSFTAIQTKAAATAIDWTIPTACYSQMGSTAKTTTITLQCITYNGDTQVGSATTTTITATCNESLCKPTVTTSYTYGSSTNTLTGVTNKGILNYSTITITVTATAKNSATISSRQVMLGGQTKSITSGSSVNFTELAAGSYTYIVKDSRGFTTTGTINLTTVAYLKPTVMFAATTPAVQTGTTTIKLQGDWFNGSFGSTTNALTVQYGYKESTASSYTWVTVTTTKSNNTYTATASVSLDATKVYYISARVKDSANTTYIQGAEQKLQTWPIINFGKSYINFNTATNFGGVSDFRNNVILEGGCSFLAEGPIAVKNGLDIYNGKWIYGFKAGDTQKYSILGMSTADKIGLGSTGLPLVVHSSEKVPVDIGLDTPVLYESGTKLEDKYLQSTFVYFGSGSASSDSPKTFTDSYGCSFYIITFQADSVWWSLTIPKTWANGSTVNERTSSSYYSWKLTKSGTTLTVSRGSTIAVSFYLYGIR